MPNDVKESIKMDLSNQDVLSEEEHKEFARKYFRDILSVSTYANGALKYLEDAGFSEEEIKEEINKVYQERLRLVRSPKVVLKSRKVTTEPVKRDTPKPRRNDPCVCGSGIKYKLCCIEQ